MPTGKVKFQSPRQKLLKHCRAGFQLKVHTKLNSLTTVAKQCTQPAAVRCIRWSFSLFEQRCLKQSELAWMHIGICRSLS